MSAISETYNRTHDILELVDVLPVIIINKNGECEWTEELPNGVRPKKISKFHWIIV